MNRISKILLVLVIVFIAVQFFPSARNQSGQAGKNSIGTVVQVPAEVDVILKKSCYDCHSNNTNYPWYANIQPVRFWLDHHIKEGKQELNFDEFGSYTKRRQSNKLRAIGNTIKEGEMPLKSYLLIHRDAKLTADQQKKIIQWVDITRDILSNEP